MQNATKGKNKLLISQCLNCSGNGFISQVAQGVRPIRSAVRVLVSGAWGGCTLSVQGTCRVELDRLVICLFEKLKSREEKVKKSPKDPEDQARGARMIDRPSFRQLIDR